MRSSLCLHPYAAVRLTHVPNATNKHRPGRSISTYASLCLFIPTDCKRIIIVLKCIAILKKKELKLTKKRHFPLNNKKMHPITLTHRPCKQTYEDTHTQNISNNSQNQ